MAGPDVYITGVGRMFVPLVGWQAGAAVYVAGPGGLDMQGCTFKDNRAVSVGADGSIVVTVWPYSILILRFRQVVS